MSRFIIVTPQKGVFCLLTKDLFPIFANGAAIFGVSSAVSFETFVEANNFAETILKPVLSEGYSILEVPDAKKKLVNVVDLIRAGYGGHVFDMFMALPGLASKVQ